MPGHAEKSKMAYNQHQGSRFSQLTLVIRHNYHGPSQYKLPIAGLGDGGGGGGGGDWSLGFVLPSSSDLVQIQELSNLLAVKVSIFETTLKVCQKRKENVMSQKRKRPKFGKRHKSKALWAVSCLFSIFLCNLRFQC